MKKGAGHLETDIKKMLAETSVGKDRHVKNMLCRASWETAT